MEGDTEQQKIVEPEKQNSQKSNKNDDKPQVSRVREGKRSEARRSETSKLQIKSWKPKL